jgi:Sec-independent protein translocase protein TatA
VFGLGPQELGIIAVLLLIIFGPTKFSSFVQDVGRLVNGAQRTVEDVKAELVSEEVEEARRAVEDAKRALVSSRE